MEVAIISLCSAFIVLLTVVNIIKAIRIAYKRNEISFQKSIFISTIAFVISVIIISVLPFLYEKIFNYIM